jgi:hypothetical protein
MPAIAQELCQVGISQAAGAKGIPRRGEIINSIGNEDTETS